MSVGIHGFIAGLVFSGAFAAAVWVIAETVLTAWPKITAALAGRSRGRGL